MATITAKLKNNDLTIVGSGLSPGQTLQENLTFHLEGYDPLVLPYTILGSPLVLPEIDVSVRNIQGLTHKVYDIEVLSPGTYNVSVDNPNIIMKNDGTQRRITLSVPPALQFQNQTGLLTISIIGYEDRLIPIDLAKVDIIDIQPISGPLIDAPVKDPLIFEVIGTTRPIQVVSNNNDIQVSVKSKRVTLTTNRPLKGTIIISGDGIMPKQSNVSFRNLQMSPSWLPVNREVHYRGQIKVAFTGMNRSDITYSIANNNQGFDTVTVVEDPTHPESFIITAKAGVENREITFSAPGYDDLVETVTFTKDTVSITQGNQVETFADEELILNVTGTNKDFLVQSLDTDILDVQVTGNDITVTPNNPGTTQIKILGIYVNDHTIDARVKPLLDISTVPVTGTVSGKYNQTLNIEVTPVQGLSYDLISSPQGAITVQKVGNTYQLSTNQPCKGTLTFKAKNHNNKTFDVVFKDFDPITYTVTPSSIVEINQVISVQVTDPLNGTGITPNIGGTIQTVDKGNGLYEFTSSNIETEELTLSAAGYKNTKLQLTFKDIYRGPQFTVDNVDVDVLESTPYTDVEVKDLVGTLSAISKDMDLIDTGLYRKGNQVFVRLELQRPVTQEERTEVTLSVPGQNDVVLNVTVRNDVVYVPEITVDKEVIHAEVGEEVYLVGPTPEPNDNLVVNAPLNVQSRIDVDRIYLKSDVADTYKVELELTDHKNKTVEFIVSPVPVVLPPVPQKWFDLGIAPHIQIVSTEDTFVEKVFTDPRFTTDKERLAYVLENGSPVIKGFLLSLCEYQEIMSKKSAVDLLKHNRGGHQNFMLYGRIMDFLNVPSYYLFRSFMMLLLKVTKHYQDDAFNIISLLRFKDKFQGTPTQWRDYASVMRLATDYIKTNGQGVTTKDLFFDANILAKFERFLLENYQP